jgi:hypothetical protein
MLESERRREQMRNGLLARQGREQRAVRHAHWQWQSYRRGHPKLERALWRRGRIRNARPSGQVATTPQMMRREWPPARGGFRLTRSAPGLERRRAVADARPGLRGQPVGAPAPCDRRPCASRRSICGVLCASRILPALNSPLLLAGTQINMTFARNYIHEVNSSFYREPNGATPNFNSG